MWQDVIIELAEFSMKAAVFGVWFAVSFAVVGAIFMIVSILLG